MTCAREASIIPTAERRLWGQSARGPSGVAAQSRARVRAPISPPPISQPGWLMLFMRNSYARAGSLNVGGVLQRTVRAPCLLKYRFPRFLPCLEKEVHGQGPDRR